MYLLKNDLKSKTNFIKTMFYEIFLILVGVYIEQNYHLPSIALNLHKLQTQYQEQYQNGNEQGENFLQDFFKSLLNKKK